MSNGRPYVQARWLTSEEELAIAEGFDFGSIARAIGPALATAAPGAIQGAQAGAVAGPWGALLGGLAGGALSLAKPPSPPSPAPSPSALAPTPAGPVAAPSAPVAAPSVPTVAAPLVTSPGAAPTASGQLMQLLTNPAFQQAVAALASGQGRTAAGLAAGPVLNLLGTLANNAAYEAETVQPGIDDSYLRGPDGRFLRDPSAPGERAAIVWDQLFASRPSSAPPVSEADALVEWLVDSGIAERGR